MENGMEEKLDYYESRVIALEKALAEAQEENNSLLNDLLDARNNR